MSAKTRGIVIGLDHEQLIIEASPAEVAQFALGMAVDAAASRPTATLEDVNKLLTDGFLYDKNGRRVARISSVFSETATVDVTSFGDAGKIYVPGLPRYRIEAAGPVKVWLVAALRVEPRLEDVRAVSSDSAPV